MKRIIAVLFACLCASNLYASLAPVTYSFDCVTNSIAGDASIGESQLWMEVAPTTDGVQFTFHNDGPDAAVITSIYFYDGLDDGVLLDLSFIDNSCDGVTLLKEEGKLGHLPGFNPDALAVYGAADRLSQGGIHNGVDSGDPGEWVTIHWSLQEGYTYQSLLDSLAQHVVVVGVHVQAFCSGGSESFINTRIPTPVPEPATLLLLGLGSLTLFFKR